MKASLNFTNSEAEKTKVFMTQAEIDQAKTLNTLKQYRELVDAKVLTEAEFITLKKKYLDKLWLTVALYKYDPDNTYINIMAGGLTK